MAVTVDSVIVELEAKVAGFEADLRRAQRTADTSLGRTDRAIQRTETQMRQSSSAIQGTLRNLAGAFAAAFTGRELLGLIDGFTRFQNQLRVAGLEGEQLANVQEKLRTIGGQYGVELEGLSAIFSRVSQVQGELGVGTEDIIRLNEIVAASLKVSGASAAQAQGALLQLSQALGSGTVRAEEFNSILEGALPLAQAAARGIEGMGGSVAKLRAEVIEGNISSKEFFDGVLAGGVETLAQAENATLTLSGAFTALRNELTILVGEEAKANGVTEALSSAITSLAENLDTVINALAVIATVMGGRFAASMVLAARNAVGLRLAAIGMSTALNGTAASARVAGAALLTAFGGPVGLAISAVTIGLGVAAQASAEASAETARLTDVAERNAQEFLDLGDAAQTAARETAHLTTEQIAAQASAAGLTVDVNRLADAHYRAAVAARTQAIEEQRLAVATAGRLAAERGQQIRNEANRTSRSGANQTGIFRDGGILGGNGGSGFFGTGQQRNSSFTNDTGRQFLESQEARDFQTAQATLQAMIDAPIPDAIESPASGASNATRAAQARARRTGGAGGRAGRQGRSGPTAAELAEEQAERNFRATQEEARLNAELLQAKAALANNAQDRADLELSLLDNEAAQRRAAIQTNKDLDEQQRQAQLAIIDQLFGRIGEADEFGNITVRAKNGLLREEVIRQQISDQYQEQLSLEQEIADGKREQLSGELDRAVTLEDRRQLQLDIIGIEFEQREAALEALLNTRDLSDVKRQEVELALKNLQTERSNAEDRARRDTESPFEEFQRGLNESLLTVDEQIEAIAVGALDDLTSGLGEALAAGESLGDVFESAGKRALSALLELTFQLLVIKPLVDSLGGGLGGIGGGGGGIGGIGGLLGGLFGGGRQTGGPVSAGRLYQVNEGAGQGIELFQPATNGNVIPLGQVPAMTQSSGGQSNEPAVIRLTVAEGAAFEPMVEAISGRVSVETVRESAPQIVSASVNETLKASRRRRT